MFILQKSSTWSTWTNDMYLASMMPSATFATWLVSVIMHNCETLTRFTVAKNERDMLGPDDALHRKVFIALCGCYKLEKLHYSHTSVSGDDERMLLAMPSLTDICLPQSMRRSVIQALQQPRQHELKVFQTNEKPAIV